jgi:excisionase family DNA binding protein
MSPLAFDTTAGTDAATIDENEVLDVPHVAELLAVGKNTIYALVARNQIPHRRLGKAIRFSRAAVMSWLASWSSRDAEERH